MLTSEILKPTTLIHGDGTLSKHIFSPNSSENSVTHASFTLTPSEKNYGQIEEQVLAMALTFAVKKFYKYILTSHFTLSTDHNPLLPIFGSKSIPTYSTNLLTRQNYGTKIRKTTDFGQADGRSVNVSIDTEKVAQSIPVDSFRNIPLIPKQIPPELAKDPVLQKAVNRVLRK